MCIGEGCVTISLNINDKTTRGMIDSGASKSIMDIGTFETLGIQNMYGNDMSTCFTDASNNKMAISGCCKVKLYIPELNRTLFHEFNVLNEKTYKTILLGRDFFAKLGPVTIDVPNNRIKLGRRWIVGEKPNNRFRVNCSDNLILHAIIVLYQCYLSN